MLTPTLDWTWEHALSAEGTLACSRWFRSDTVMTIKVVSQNHLFTVSVVLIINSILTFFYQMLVCLLNFNYLLALPTSYKHGTLFPIMDVYRLAVKTLIISTTKATRLLILNWIIILLIVLLNLSDLAFFLLSICYTSRLVLSLRFGSWSYRDRSFGALRTYVGWDVDDRFRLNLIFSLILLLTPWLHISLRYCIFYLLYLRRSQLTKAFLYPLPH